MICGVLENKQKDLFRSSVLSPNTSLSWHQIELWKCFTTRPQVCGHKRLTRDQRTLSLLLHYWLWLSISWAESALTSADNDQPYIFTMLSPVHHNIKRHQVNLMLRLVGASVRCLLKCMQWLVGWKRRAADREGGQSVLRRCCFWSQDLLGIRKI